MEVKRGEIYFAELGNDYVGSEQSGSRPVLIVQNNIGNKFSPTVIVACVTSKVYRNTLPTHVRLDKTVYGLEQDSLVLCEQIKTIDKSRLRSKVAELRPTDTERVNRAIRLSVGV